MKMGLTVAVKMLQSMNWLCQSFATFKYGSFFNLFNFSVLIETRPCICEVIGLCSTRWCHRRTDARIPRGNITYETNRVSPEHIELIGLLYFDKSHVPCCGICKEWGFTSLPQGKKRAGDVIELKISISNLVRKLLKTSLLTKTFY